MCERPKQRSLEKYIYARAREVLHFGIHARRTLVSFLLKYITHACILYLFSKIEHLIFIGSCIVYIGVKCIILFTFAPPRSSKGAPRRKGAPPFLRSPNRGAFCPLFSNFSIFLKFCVFSKSAIFSDFSYFFLKFLISSNFSVSLN